MGKEILDGYVGVKYRGVCTSHEMPAKCSELYELFRRCGDRLGEHNMTPANGGNLSTRCDENDMVITASGCNLGFIEPEEMALVTMCSLETESVTYEGPIAPSSEAMLHWLIYRDFPAAGAVVHAHDELATSSAVAEHLAETPQEEPYGTVALASLAATTFDRGGDIIVLKNHGYVARGRDLEDATERVVRMHLKLIEK